MSEATRSVVASRDVSRLNVRGSVRADTTRLAAAGGAAGRAAGRRGRGCSVPPQAAQAARASGAGPNRQAGREVGRNVWSKAGPPARKLATQISVQLGRRTQFCVQFVGPVTRPKSAGQILGRRLWLPSFSDSVELDSTNYCTTTTCTCHVPDGRAGAGFWRTHCACPSATGRINGFGRAYFGNSVSRLVSAAASRWTTPPSCSASPAEPSTTGFAKAAC